MSTGVFADVFVSCSVEWWDWVVLLVILRWLLVIKLDIDKHSYIYDMYCTNHKIIPDHTLEPRLSGESQNNYAIFS